MNLEQKLRILKHKAERASLISEKLFDVSHGLFELAEKSLGLRKRWYKAQAIIIQSLGCRYLCSKYNNEYYNLRRNILKSSKEYKSILESIPV